MPPDRERERKIVEQARQQGRSDDFIRQAIVRDRERRQQVSTSLMTSQQEQQTPTTLRERAAGLLGSIFGGQQIGEAIGTGIARRSFAQQAPPQTGLTPEETQRAEEIFRRNTGRDVDFSPEGIQQQVLESEALTGPTRKQVAGDVARTALLFTPIGRAGGAATGLLRGAGLRRGAALAGQTVAGGGTGVAFDIAEDVAEGRDIGLGGGTVTGTGLPLVSRGIGIAGRGIARLGRETSGAITGTSAETLEQAFEAGRRGGRQQDAFIQALRGQTTPEALVTSLRDNISEVATRRGNRYEQSLGRIANRTVSTRGAQNEFRDALKNAGITVDRVEDAGRTIERLNFNDSALRRVPEAQRRLREAFVEFQNLPDNIRIDDLDTARQVIGNLRLVGDDRSANLANKLLDDARRSIRSAGEKVPGYGKLLDEFGETSEFLDELQRGVSAGDRNTIDQTYRRLITTLRTNNEQRMALVRELDEATGGLILQRVAGQQLSETLPRGIIRAFAASLGGAGLVVGGLPGVVPALSTLIYASPRVTGEVVRALGVGRRKADEIIKAIGDVRAILTRAGLITSDILEE